MARSKCVLCEDKIEKIHTINNIPSFMGVVESNTNIVKNDMVIGECLNCGLLQNINLLDPDLIYLNNHNTQVVGDIWKNHYVELSDFIKENSNGNVIFEIGDPSAKLAKKLKDNYKKWIIIEPNTDTKSFDNVEIIKGFFQGINPTNYIVSTIVHSHVLEHMYEPVEFLKECNNILQDGGVTIFSIPNIKWLMNNKALPTGILHFEHTYYINEDNIEYFLNKSGFELNEIKYYKNHSLFIKATKKELSNINITKSNNKDVFLDLVHYYDDKIKNINNKLLKKEYYLYSAHINSQYMINNGISNNIKALLDKSESKIGKKLYGYDYDILSPDSISNDESPIVLASHMGVYYEEIKNNLLEINKNVIVL